jgi:phosphopentomutase
VQRLWDLCHIARELVDEYRIGRVIARPFVGKSAADFTRTGNRHDYAVKPPAPTVFDKLVSSGGEVVGIGKIPDIFAHTGITREVKAFRNDEVFETTLAQWRAARDRSMVVSNFVDFDSMYGHRRDVEGYGSALEAFDRQLPELVDSLGDGDVLVLTADHGCDPTWPGSDHTREHVPVLVAGPRIQPAPLGTRSTFADIGQSLAHWFELPAMGHGTSFLA